MSFLGKAIEGIWWVLLYIVGPGQKVSFIDAIASCILNEIGFVLGWLLHMFIEY